MGTGQILVCGKGRQPIQHGLNAGLRYGMAHLPRSGRDSRYQARQSNYPISYRRAELRHALIAFGRWTVQITKRSDTAQGFEILPRRWVVERAFAWLGRWRRLAKDFETNITSSTAWTLIAHVRRLTRPLARA
jgi:hypothetical protein